MSKFFKLISPYINHIYVKAAWNQEADGLILDKSNWLALKVIVLFQVYVVVKKA